jgi:hypothetical protein
MHSFLAGSGQQFTISLSKEKQFSVWGIEVNGRVKHDSVNSSCLSLVVAIFVKRHNVRFETVREQRRVGTGPRHVRRSYWPGKTMFDFG